MNSYLLKGYVPPKSLKSKYVDPKKIIMHEDKPLILIPHFNLNFTNFLTDDSPE